jgi:CheY-like chemotaxis protein
MASILIVEDDKNNQHILTYILTKAGFTTISAENGATALEILGRTVVDLAIVDFAMPIMNGISLLKRIRETENIKHLPIIILTGSGDDEERIVAESVGIQGFLNKPVSSKIILKAVTDALTTNAKS